MTALTQAVTSFEAQLSEVVETFTSANDLAETKASQANASAITAFDKAAEALTSKNAANEKAAEASGHANAASGQADLATNAAATTQTLRDSIIATQGAIGYLPPVAYAAALNMTLPAQTVSYLGQAYAPLLSALPFTTSGTFETAKFRLIQGVAAVDLAAAGGAGMLGTVQDGIGAVLRTQQDKNREFVTPEDFGALGGLINDKLAIDKAVAECLRSGRPLLWTGPSYTYIGNLYSKPINMVGIGRPKIYVTGRFQFQSDADALATTTLAANAACGATAVTLTSATGVVAGQLLVITDGTVMDTAYNRGSFTAAIVKSVAGASVTLMEPLVFPLFSGASVSVRPAMTCAVDGLDFYMPAVPGSNVYCLIYSGLVGASMTNTRFYEPTRQMSVLNNAFFAQQCYDTKVDGYHSDGPLYGISLPGSRFTKITNTTMNNGRHPVVPSYGASDIDVDGLVTRSCSSALDGHVAFNITYRNVKDFNPKEWFALRALGVTLENVMIENTASAPTGSPQLHNNFLSPAYAALNQEFDLKVSDFKISDPAAASVDISVGRNVDLLGWIAPNLTVAVGGGAALQVASFRSSNCQFAKQGNTRTLLVNMRGTDERLDAVLNAGSYEIRTWEGFIKNTGYNAKCNGILVPEASQAASFSVNVKIMDGFGYAPAAYLRYISGFITLLVKDITGVRKKRYSFIHNVAASSGIAFNLTPLLSELAGTAPTDITVSNATQAGVTQVSSVRTAHYVAFDVAVALPSSPRNVELSYELELFGMP